MPALKFPKSWLRTLGYRQKIHHYFFSHKWGTRFKYLSKLCPYILMYSALHIMQWFSQVLDVFTLKIKRKFFDFYILWIKTNVAYTRLEMIARTKYCTTTTASNWLLLCTVNCSLQWDHLPNMAVGDLAFYYTLYLWLLHIWVSLRGNCTLTKNWCVLCSISCFGGKKIYKSYSKLSKELENSIKI